MSLEKLTNDEPNFRWYHRLTPTVNEWALYAFLSVACTPYLTDLITKRIAEDHLGGQLNEKIIALSTIASFFPQILLYATIRTQEFINYLADYGNFMGNIEKKRNFD